MISEKKDLLLGSSGSSNTETPDHKNTEVNHAYQMDGSLTNSYPLQQGCPTLVLRGPCPEGFRCFSAPTHLMLMTGRHQASTELDNDPFI